MTTVEAAIERAGAPGLSMPWGRALGLAAYLAIVFGPVGALALATASRLLADPTLIRLAIPAGRWALLGRSLGLALSVAVLAVTLGTFIATVLWRWRSGWLASLRWALVALAVVPGYVHALAWSRALHRAGASLSAAGLDGVSASGVVATAWVQAMALLPLAAVLCLLAVEAVPDELIEAARVLRPDDVVMRRIAWPLARPMVLAVAGVVFVLALLDYSVPALYQVNVYSLAAFAQYSSGNDPIEAFLVALPLVVVAGAIVTASQIGIRSTGQQPVRRGRARGQPLRLPPWFRIAQAAACAVLALQVAVPLFTLFGLVGTREAFVATLWASRAEIGTSAAVAAAASVASVPLAAVAAAGLARRGRSSRAWWFLVTLPLAVPASLVGIGLIGVWNRPGLPGVYGSLAMPILASLARFVPFAALAVYAHERRVDRLLVDAARVLQRSALQGWIRVRLPLMAPGLLAAACLVCVLTLGELGATLIVVPPGHQTLTLRIYNYLHYGASDAVAGLCLAMSVTAIALGAAALAAISIWTRGPTRRGTSL